MRGIKSEDSGIDRDVYRKSTRKALANLIDYAIRENVDFVMLGGDNYDGNWDTYETGLFFLEQMARLGKIPVIAITGNHDAANKMTFSLNKPPNYTLLSSDKPDIHDKIDGIRIVGQGFKDQAENRNLAMTYPQLSGSGIKIGLLHTSLEGKPDHDRYAPCTYDDLMSKNYHFWGLGHIHKHSWEERSGDPPILFPGNLQGRSIRETGPKGAWLIELNDDGELINKHFEPLDVTRWVHLILPIDEMTRLDDLWKKCELELARERAGSQDRILAVRVELTGENELHRKLVQLREGIEDGLLNNMQQAANNAAPNRIWIEKVSLNTRFPKTGSHLNSTALGFLKNFLNGTAGEERWINEFLANSDIQKLLKQTTLFQEDDDRSYLESQFSHESIRAMIGDIPEILESRLLDQELAQENTES